MFERKEIFRKSESGSIPIPRTPSSDTGLSAKSVFIGQSIFIKGELTGNEDMAIEGKVEGHIRLQDHNVTIGSNGTIEAEIFAKNITIMGTVQGDVHAESLVEIKKTGMLTGDIVAPRVIIEDGARFRGSIDMETRASSAGSGSPKQESKGKENTAALAIENLKTKAEAS
ncbi:MAG: polymer-forming cytoskeletal protein [Deltaproteobacteria bacterium]|nr:polymer-forming cytoskeletal protein [Deltaproteobacteria bacterium]